MDFILWCSADKLAFCIAEVESLVSLISHPVTLDKTGFCEDSPYLYIQADENSIDILLNKSVLVKSAYKIILQEENDNELIESIKTNRKLIERILEKRKYKMEWIATGKKIEQGMRQRMMDTLIDTLDQSTPSPVSYDILLTVLTTGKGVFLGTYSGDSSRRNKISLLDLKKRRYIGNTSMDAELSLIMANVGRVDDGSIIYDPFVGTGSVLCGCCYQGGYGIGSDIDSRQINGAIYVRGGYNRKRTSIRTNMEDYGLASRYIGCSVIDIAKPSLRKRRFIDSIITDPPYGIRVGLREGGKVTGVEYLMSVLFKTASDYLVNNGRLVFWVYEKNRDDRKHCFKEIGNENGFRMIYDLEQKLGITRARFLQVFEKIC
eukprot:GHVP01031068.1.p1 GENE.GHVP01031068.1~~GHVP01031068.1.p1  ORF type:complete len:376 (-),score=60.06 GHVP01031068.1:203-1330(-)